MTIKTKELKGDHYMFGNKGAVWSNKVHIAKSGDGTHRTLCGNVDVKNVSKFIKTLSNMTQQEANRRTGYKTQTIDEKSEEFQINLVCVKQYRSKHWITMYKDNIVSIGDSPKESMDKAIKKLTS